MAKLFAGTNPDISERELTHAKVAREMAQEGLVVLKNDGLLPIPAQKIALFGAGARRTVKGGTGSGSVNERYSVSIEEGLEAAGFTVTTKSWLERYYKYYDDTLNEWKAEREADIVGLTDIMEILGKVGSVPFVYPTGIAIENSDLSPDTDTAIYVLARQAGEGADRPIEKGEYLLDDVEYENIKTLTEHFANTIVVINSGSPIDLSPIEALPLKALIYYGQAGQEGGNALANVISGKVTPSGKLTFSWAKSYSDNPFGEHYGAMGNAFEQDYLEDIYVGYRYYDTFGVAPAYPFGFGLSYTQFEITESNVKWDGKKFTVSGEVKNVGKCAGKEVVQVYATVPFGKEGAEYQRLVAFCKTPLLEAGKKCSYSAQFTPDELTKYDTPRAAFVLEKGSYTVRVGNSSRNTTPVSNILLNEDVVTEKCVNICKPKKQLDILCAPARTENLSGVKEITLKAKDIKTKKHVYNAPVLKISAKDKEILDRLSVEELAKLVIGGGTQGKRIVEVFGASGSTTSDLYDKYGIPNIITLDGPGGLNVGNKFSVNSKGEITALYVPPAYDFGIFGKYLRECMAKAQEDGTEHYQYATAWPSSCVMAQTWNTELVERFGHCIGIEMKEFGASVWLAPGMNIQKNPLCGRNFEYYSEDPLVSGKLAAVVTNAVQSYGIAVSIKHFCCNNVECERDKSSSNLTERALREIYLKGFRIAVETSQPMTVMSSYNLINGVYNCNNPELLVKVLRNEWGFKGLVMTDWSACGEGKGDAVKAVAAQNDWVMPGTPAEEETIVKAVKEGTLSFDALYLSAARTLALIRKTTAIPFAKK